MNYNNRFGGAIWTNHALDRLAERQLSQEYAWQALQDPDKHFAGKKAGTTEFQKRFGKSLVTVIATKTEKNEWLILSCWVNPPMYGTKDYYKKQDYKRYKNASFWGRVWMDIKYLLGLS